MPIPVTVAIPVGPLAHHSQWLAEAFASALGQTEPPSEILFIDDMHGPLDLWSRAYGHGPILAHMDRGSPSFRPYTTLAARRNEETVVRVWHCPWRVGDAHAFNFGVALAANDCVFMLGSDDVMREHCLALCFNAYKALPIELRERTYFGVGVHYLDGRDDPDQTLPCNAAMVTKQLWRYTGGFAPESAAGTPDANFLSTFWGGRHGVQILMVQDGAPLYDVRVHPGQVTATRGPLQGAIHEIRDWLTSSWNEPAWGRLQ